jgi:hypothetical protein
MTASKAAEDLVQDVVRAVSTLEPFPILQFMQRLYNKARQTPNAAVFKTQLPVETEPPVDPPYWPNDGLLLNNIDASPRLQTLALQSIVTAVASLDNDTDKSGFRGCVQGVSSPRMRLAAVLVRSRTTCHDVRQESRLTFVCNPGSSYRGNKQRYPFVD